jgi:glycosyltransferase involved in cell wall biosynthesis
MLNGARVAVIMPGLRVAKTLERTVRAIPAHVVDDIIYVDDGSNDDSIRVAKSLGLTVFAHGRNLGYGAGQKTGYREALALGADIAVMVHPDFQYKPELVPAIASMIAYGGYDLALASRVLMGSAIAGGMPRWKFVVNRGLTHVENAMLGASLSEYHTGYRAFSRRVLEALPLAENRNDFVFDNEMLAQAIHFGFSIGEISCPAHYFEEMSTISFLPGVRYGVGVLGAASRLVMHRAGLKTSPCFDRNGRGLGAWTEGKRVE